MDRQNQVSIPQRDDGGTDEIRVLAAAVAAMFGYLIVPNGGCAETTPVLRDLQSGRSGRSVLSGCPAGRPIGKQS